MLDLFYQYTCMFKEYTKNVFIYPILAPLRSSNFSVMNMLLHSSLHVILFLSYLVTRLMLLLQEASSLKYPYHDVFIWLDIDSICI